MRTEENINKLIDNKLNIYGPGSGEQACGDVGLGRMLEPEEIISSFSLLFEEGELINKNILITAGPTQEPIDPVRYITNKSSGKMGYSLAEAGLESGAKVTLISGPVNIEAPEEELKTRIYSLIGDVDSEELKFESLTMNLRTFEAIVDEEVLDLTFMEYQLLKFFVENQNTVWSREELLEKVWGYQYFGGERTVDVHVRRLRVKLGPSSSWIKTVHSVGYKFN